MAMVIFKKCKSDHVTPPAKTVEFPLHLESTRSSYWRYMALLFPPGSTPCLLASLDFSSLSKLFQAAGPLHMPFSLFRNLHPPLSFQVTFSSHSSDLTLNVTSSGRTSLTVFSKQSFSLWSLVSNFIIAFITICHYFYLLLLIIFLFSDLFSASDTWPWMAKAMFLSFTIAPFLSRKALGTK